MAYRKTSTFDAAIKVAVVRDRESKRESIRWLVRNVTERKRADEEVRRLSAERERLLKEHEEFIALFSHDLRPPLTVIKGFAQLSERHPEQAETVRWEGGAIRASAERMGHMISDLAEAGRIRAGRLVLKRQPLAVATFVTEAARRLGVPTETERLRVEVPSKLPRVLADPNGLERILTNLITNALKYSDGQVTICGGDKEVVVTVSDRGVGIAAEDLPHIFDSYCRAKPSQSKEGLGLGLYITKRLVEAQGGRIWVESRVGEVSTFGFSLPVVDE